MASERDELLAKIDRECRIPNGAVCYIVMNEASAEVEAHLRDVYGPDAAIYRVEKANGNK